MIIKSKTSALDYPITMKINPRPKISSTTKTVRKLKRVAKALKINNSTSLSHFEILRMFHELADSSPFTKIRFSDISLCSQLENSYLAPISYFTLLPQISFRLSYKSNSFSENTIKYQRIRSKTIRNTNRRQTKTNLDISGKTIPKQCRSWEGEAEFQNTLTSSKTEIHKKLNVSLQEAISPGNRYSTNFVDTPHESMCSSTPLLCSFRHIRMKSSTWSERAGDLNTPENSASRERIRTATRNSSGRGTGGDASHSLLATPTPPLLIQRLISCRRGGRRTMEMEALERRSLDVGEETAENDGVREEGSEGSEGVQEEGCLGGAKDSAEWWTKKEGDSKGRKGRTPWLGFFSIWITMGLSLAVATPSSAALDNEIHAGIGSRPDPEFGDPIDNVTVAAGREARLSCVVDNLGDYRVGWLKVDSQTILSLQKRVVTHNTRISVTHDEHRTWNLHIKQVKKSDRGCYMCQINTPKMKNQVGCIEVHVPPDIIYSLTSSDTTINEKETVSLKCVAEGYPTPEIKWIREDGKPIQVRSSTSPKGLNFVSGGNLTLEKVTRSQMGAYLCIASNKVPPSVSKRIIVNVNFSPVVKVDNQLIGAPLGTEVEIQCNVEAFPKAVNYWERDNGEMMLNNKKYHLREEFDSYKVVMSLTIRNFTSEDEGKYNCISTNSLGRSDMGIRIYVIDVPDKKTTTEPAYYNPFPTTPRSKSVNSLDLRRREGKSMKGISEMDDGATESNGLNFQEKEQNRQRQRQRLDATDGRSNNGLNSILGGNFRETENQSPGGGVSNVKSSTLTLWIGFLISFLVSGSYFHSFMVASRYRRTFL